MYKVMIVDDEKIICQGVSSKIKRINHPMIGEIIESTDPIEAINITSEVKPDIIITDMKMPNLSGLELISKISEMDINPKFLVLSGYDDYNYVRNSFQLGVVDYILKPVTIDELTKKLSQTIEMIKSEKNTTSPLDDETSIALNTIAFSNDNEESVKSYLYLDSVFEHEYFQMLSICLPSRYQLSDMNILAKKIIDIFNNDIDAINYYDSYRNCIILLNYNNIDTASYIQSRLKNFLSDLSKIGNYEAKIALTTPTENLYEYKNLLFELHKIIASKIQYRPYALMAKNNLHVENKSKREEIITQILKWFAAKDYKNIENFIDSYFSFKPFIKDSYTSPNKIYIIIQQKINELFGNNDLYQKELFTRAFESFDSYMEIRLYLRGCLKKIQVIIEERDSASISAVEMAKTYIDEHLNEPLTMAQVSNYLSLNYSYFSKLFKETIGISFKKYLMDKRMEKAKILLQNPTNRVYEIANLTGYDNAQNFSRAFKTHFGISPKEYRTREELS